MTASELDISVVIYAHTEERWEQLLGAVESRAPWSAPARARR
jgi:hypothetical protein